MIVNPTPQVGIHHQPVSGSSTSAWYLGRFCERKALFSAPTPESRAVTDWGMFVRLSHSWAGTLIISDFTLLDHTFIVWQVERVAGFTVPFLPATGVENNAVGIENDWKKGGKTGVGGGWSKQSQRDQSRWGEEKRVHDESGEAGGGRWS